MVDQDATPIERLISQYGEQNTEIAIEGLKNYIQKATLPTPEQVTELNNEGKYNYSWYAILASLTESFLANPDLDIYPEETLHTCLTIRLHLHFHPNLDPGWSKTLFESKPQLAVKVYSKTILSQLAKRTERINEVDVLCSDDRLKPYRKDALKKILYAFPDMPKETARILIEAGIESFTKTESIDLIGYALAQCHVKERTRSIWYSFALILDFERYAGAVQRYSKEDKHILGEICTTFGWAKSNPTIHISIRKLVFIIKLLAVTYPQAEFKDGPKEEEWDAWESSRFVSSLIELIATKTSDEATQALEGLIATESLESYRNLTLRSLAEHKELCRQKRYKQPDWKLTVSALFSGSPANVADLWALTKEFLKEINKNIKGGTTDTYKVFWNQDQYARPTRPMVEETCRDRLIELLKPFYDPHSIRLEPEGHMVQDKRADIVLYLSHNQKLPMELKRDTNDELWTACHNQLDRMYTIDPESQRYGIYVVFWFGKKRVGNITNHPGGLTAPETPEELETQLRSLIKAKDRYRLDVFVLDVTEPLPKSD